jgi:hypothetical protein
MRGWVCNLLVQLHLGIARAVTLGSKSRRTRDHILLPHMRLPLPGGPGPSIYVFPKATRGFEPISYTALLSALLHDTVYVFTQFDECTSTDCK